jgi:hypothetical protein
MDNTFNQQGIGLGAGIPIMNLSSGDTKLSGDRYEIYVNEDFVGYKTLFNVSDSLTDVDDFLKTQGVQNFSSELDGDHYKIIADEANRIREILDIYCQNR